MILARCWESAPPQKLIGSRSVGLRLAALYNGSRIRRWIDTSPSKRRPEFCIVIEVVFAFRSSAGRLCFALLFASAVNLIGQEPRVDALLDEAAKQFAEGNVAAAEQNVDKVLARAPDDLRALILKGAVLDSQQRYADAERWYEEALKLAPNSSQVLNNVGNHYLAAGNL